MKKIALIFSMIILAGGVFGQKSFYDFKVKDIEGNDFDLSTLKHFPVIPDVKGRIRFNKPATLKSK